MDKLLNKLKTIFVKFKFSNREPPKILGRWKIESCHKKTDNKIDLSNIDHCGPCGQYLVEQKTEIDKKNKT